MSRKYKSRALPRGILIDRNLVYVRIFPNGKIFQKCYGNVNQKDVVNTAIADLAKIREQIRLGKFQQEDKIQRILFCDAVDLFLSKHGNRWKSSLKPFKEFFSGLYSDEITYVKLQAFRPWFLANHSIKRRIHGVLTTVAPKETTANRYLTGLSSWYSHLKRWITIQEIRPLLLPPENPVTLVRGLKGGWYNEHLNRRKRILSRDEFEVLMEVATPRFRRFCLAALNTALRKKDVLALDEKTIDVAANQIEGLQNKTGSRYVLPKNSNMQWLFDTSTSSVIESMNFRREYERSRQRFMERTGAESFWLTDLRRTALRKVWEETKNLLLCRDLAGHGDAKTTQLYLGLTDSDIQLAGQILEKHFSRPIQTVGISIGNEIVTVEESHEKD